MSKEKEKLRRGIFVVVCNTKQKVTSTSGAGVCRAPPAPQGRPRVIDSDAKGLRCVDARRPRARRRVADSVTRASQGPGPQERRAETRTLGRFAATSPPAPPSAPRCPRAGARSGGAGSGASEARVSRPRKGRGARRWRATRPPTSTARLRRRAAPRSARTLRRPARRSKWSTSGPRRRGPAAHSPRPHTPDTPDTPHSRLPTLPARRPPGADSLLSGLPASARGPSLSKRLPRGLDRK